MTSTEKMPDPSQIDQHTAALARQLAEAIHPDKTDDEAPILKHARPAWNRIRAEGIEKHFGIMLPILRPFFERLAMLEEENERLKKAAEREYQEYQQYPHEGAKRKLWLDEATNTLAELDALIGGQPGEITVSKTTEQIDSIMASITPIEFRYRWCGGENGPCACLGCVQICSRALMYEKVYGAKCPFDPERLVVESFPLDIREACTITREEWEAWKVRHPEPPEVAQCAIDRSVVPMDATVVRREADTIAAGVRGVIVWRFALSDGIETTAEEGKEEA